MKPRRRRRLLLPSVTATLILSGLYAHTSNAAKTFYMDESTDFTGNGCENVDLNTVTASLRDMLVSFGWTGSRFVNPSAFPEDFIEACNSSFGNGGLDSTFGDTKSFSVYAGHGNVGLLGWGFKHNSRCTIDFSDNMRLGSMAGAASANAAYITSCTLKVESLPNEANFQWVRQQMGFDNSPSVGDADPGNFAWCSRQNNNASCWVSALEDQPGIFSGDNSPIVVSHGANSSDCQFVQSHASLVEDMLNTPIGGGPSCQGAQPGFWYCYYWVDHGGC